MTKSRRPPSSDTRAPAPLQRSSWFMKWLLDAPSRWLGRRSTAGQHFAAAADGLSYLRNLARGNHIRRTATFEETKLSAPPVLLIHGFLGTRGSMYLLERRLVEDGFVVVSFNIGALNSRDIRRSAFLIHRKIERILAQTPSQKIDIVGHSMGGLIGLYYLKKLGGHARVRRLIMMGTPVRGTWVALAGIATLGFLSTSSWQLLPRSRFLDELAQGPIPEGSEVYSIAAARDWVAPPSSTKLPGASLVTVPLGHSSLVVAEDVYRRLVSILRQPPTASANAHDADDGTFAPQGGEHDGEEGAWDADEAAELAAAAMAASKRGPSK